jgi:hypothetical protein
MKNCITMPDGSLFCLPIYYERKFKKPEPDPLLHLKRDEILEANSHFGELIKKGKMDKNALIDASYLGQINEIVGLLSKDMQENFKNGLNKSIEVLNEKHDMNLKY